ncbi:MAG TPA: protein kinase [Thermoanaerobaculia bacterium]|nr:protein kinase [Thermoanaerobaculia bacterium]
MSITAGTRFGPYEVMSLLGEGGMGQVYRAIDPRLGREIAIKVLVQDGAEDHESISRFEREARAVAALSHPNILSIHDFGSQHGTFFVVTELLRGETLRQRLANGALPWRRAVEISAEIAEGLAAAHGKAIVHRDLKPENIFLTAEGRVKILDFGLAQTDPVLFASHDEDMANMPTRKFRTDPGTVIGTLGYMAPEQLLGEPVDATADIFSLGCMMFEMVTAKKPFLRSSGAGTIAAILKEDIPKDDLSEVVPPELQRIIEGCVEKARTARFQSARDLALTLRAIASSSSIIKGGLLEALGAKRRSSKRSIDSIAVLPLTNAGTDAGTEYLSDGITEGIINRLSQLPKLKVMARSTVFRYKGREVDAQTIGRDLRIRAVLTGRVQPLGDRLSINVELVDAIDGSQLWGEQYNRPLRDLMSLQEEMSREIADKLRLKLTGAERKRLRKRTTESGEAYQLYLKGRYHWNKRTEESLNKGIQFFRQAIESDPSFASAYAGLADSFITLGTNIPLPPAEAMPKAKAAATKALEIEDGLAEAWVSLAAVRWWYEWDWSGAEEAYRRAIELNPNYATAHDGYAMFLCARGRFTEAIEQITKASDLDPLSLIIAVHAGWPYHFARDFESAIQRFRKALELDSRFIPAHGWLGMALGQQQRYDEAITCFRDALLVDPIPILLAMLCHTYAIAGRRDEAERVFGELLEETRSRYVSAYDVAMIEVGLGNHDAAIVTLGKAFEERSAWMVFLNVDPRLDPLRADPGFQKLAAQLGR